MADSKFLSNCPQDIMIIYCSAMATAYNIYNKATDGGLEELLRAGVDINTGNEVTPAAPSRVADR